MPQHNELRKDYLLNRWVVIATERCRRPTDFARPTPKTAKTCICPLCVGNENMTPPAIMLYLKENGKITKSQDPHTGDRPQNWLIRDIPNLYPAFTPPKHHSQQVVTGDDCCFAVGHHEVLVESPVHEENLADVKLPQLELLINAYIERFKELSAKPYVEYVSIFRNYRCEAGASLSHPHSQIIATPIVPVNIQGELQASREFHEKHGKCVFCEILEKERSGPRLVLENEGFVVFAPYASIYPLEFWIVPKKHSPNILNLSETEVSSFARTLKNSLKALKDVVNDPPYNYGIHLSITEDDQDYYHWHLEVYPKLAIWAGFEKSTGIYINTVPPEIAAESLRKAIER